MMSRRSKDQIEYAKLQQLIRAKKDQWEEFERWPMFYTAEFIRKQANLLDGLINKQLDKINA